MKDFINIGSVPYEEPCAQIGQKNFSLLSKMECVAFRGQLNREFKGGDFRIKSFSHDFGRYMEVVAFFDDQVEDKRGEMAFKAEGECSANWDEEAKKQLREKGYFKLLQESKNESTRPQL